MKNLLKKKRKAFSYIEILLVAALSAIIISSVSPIALSTIKRNATNEAELQTIEIIKVARRRSLEGYKNIEWTVCKTEKSIYISDSSCSVENKFFNYDLGNGINIDGFNKITFKKYTGETSTNIEILINSLNENRIISVNQAGGYYVK